MPAGPQEASAANLLSPVCILIVAFDDEPIIVILGRLAGPLPLRPRCCSCSRCRLLLLPRRRQLRGLHRWPASLEPAGVRGDRYYAMLGTLKRWTVWTGPCHRMAAIMNQCWREENAGQTTETFAMVQPQMVASYKERCAARQLDTICSIRCGSNRSGPKLCKERQARDQC